MSDTPPAFDQYVTFYPTADLAATAAFYEEILRLPLALDQGSCRIYRVAPNAFIGFCLRQPLPEVEGIFITLVTDDVDGWQRYLVDRGVPIEKSAQHYAAYDIYHCFIRDPNGYLVEIQRFEDPTWPAPSSPTLSS